MGFPISPLFSRAAALDALATLAAGQYGIVTRQQARSLGFSDDAITRLVAAGHLHRLHRGVFAVRGSPSSWYQSSRVLLVLLDERDRQGRSESPLETRILRAIRSSKLPPPHVQYSISDEAGPIGRVDLAWPAAKLVVECDGYRFHSSPAAWRRDRERDNRLVAAGWIFLRPTSDDADAAEELVTRIGRFLLPPLV